MRILFKLENGRAASGNDGVDAILLESERYILTEVGSRISLDEVSAGYIASAVHFAGVGNSLITQSLTSTDSPNLTASLWFKIPADTSDSAQPFFINDPGDTASIVLVASVASGAIQSILAYLEDSNASNTFEFGVTAPMPMPSIGEWHHLLISAETNFDEGDKPCRIYIDDVDSGAVVIQEGASFSMVSNGLPFFFAEDQGDHLTADIAIAFIDPGLSVLVAGDIPEATRRLFISAGGKPVDPAVAVAALGNPRILFNGDATAFKTNQGTGGAFVLSRYLRTAEVSAPGPTSFTLIGAIVGNGVSFVDKSGEDVSSEFETTISVNDQIQQTGTADYTDFSVRVALTPGTLTDAGTSPSD